MNSQKVFLLLNKIPYGKVTTYKEIARISKTSPRAIGQILKRNKNPNKYPCYKVISSSGKINGYFGSLTTKKTSLLKKEGIEIKKGRVDLSRYLYTFNE